jgi:ribonuclease D
VERTRGDEEVWRISGSGKFGGRACAVLRELWQWRDQEAQAADRPAFHILQNHQLLRAAEQFAAGETPDYRHFSPRRRQGFREAAERGLNLPEAEWPVRPKRRGTRPTREMERAAEELRRRRDAVADEHGLEPSLIAPRGAIDALVADESRSDALLVPWQRSLLEL